MNAERVALIRLDESGVAVAMRLRQELAPSYYDTAPASPGRRP